jgi:excisionase family DNA binding protein
VNGAKLPNALWDELEAGLAVAELSRAGRTNPGRNPDDQPDETAESVTVAGVARIAGLRRAAALAGVPRSTFAERVKRGEVPFERRGRVYLFHRANLERTGTHG